VSKREREGKRKWTSKYVRISLCTNHRTRRTDVTVEFSKLNPPVITLFTPSPSHSLTLAISCAHTFTRIVPSSPPLSCLPRRHHWSFKILPNQPEQLSRHYEISLYRHRPPFRPQTSSPSPWRGHALYHGSSINISISIGSRSSNSNSSTNSSSSSSCSSSSIAVFDRKGPGVMRTLAIFQKLSGNTHQSLWQFGILNDILLSWVDV